MEWKTGACINLMQHTRLFYFGNHEDENMEGASITPFRRENWTDTGSFKDIEVI